MLGVVHVWFRLWLILSSAVMRMMLLLTFGPRIWRSEWRNDHCSEDGGRKYSKCLVI